MTRRRTPGQPPAPAAGPWARLRDGHQRARLAVRRLRQRLPPPVKRLVRRGTRFSLHALNGVLIAFGLVFAAAYLWLPTLADRQAEIESYVSQAVGNPVRFDGLETFWDGLNPGVQVRGFRVSPALTGEPGVSLREVRLTLAWWPLVTGRIEIGSLLLVEPSLALERSAEGRLRVTGIEMRGGADPALQNFSAWLLRQRRLAVENGTLEWIDRFGADGTEERMTVQHATITLRNDGERHVLDVRADFPAALCVGCRLHVDVTGVPVAGGDWAGTIAIEARELNLAAAPRALRALLPAGLDGRLRLDLRSDWRRGRPVAVQGRFGAHQLVVPFDTAAGTRVLALRRIDAGLDWRGSADRGRLTLDHLVLGRGELPWRAGGLRLDYAPGRIGFEADRLDLAELVALAGELGPDDLRPEWLRAAALRGVLERVAVSVSGPPGAPSDFRVAARLRGVGFAAVGVLPGVTALSGQLEVTPAGGELVLAGAAGRIDLPRVFVAPLDVERLAGRVRWRRSGEDWLVEARDLALANRDGRAEGRFELRLPTDPARSPVMRLRAAVRDGNGARVPHYLPRVLPAALRDYLAAAVVAGRVPEVRVELDGPLRQFPFRDGNGRFEVRAQVEDGEFRFLRDWAALTAIDADLRFTGTGMLIAGRSARLGALRVGQATVAIDDFKAPEGPRLRIDGRVTGPLEESQRLLRETGWPVFAAWTVPGLQAGGNGVLALGIDLPLRTLKPAIRGHYRLADGVLAFPFRDLRVEALRGSIEFTEAGPQRGSLNARFLGGQAAAELTPLAGGGARVALRGVVTRDGLTGAFGTWLAPQVSGEVSWTAGLDTTAWPGSLQVRADLGALELGFPAPLAKARGEPLQLVLRSLPAGPANWLLDLEIGGRATGRLAFVRRDGGWQFDRGRIGLAERVTALPAHDGLTLSARLASLNVDRWWQFLRADLAAGAGSGWQDLIRQVSAEVDALEAFGRPFGQLSVDLEQRAGLWQGRLAGEAIDGTVVLRQPHCRPGQRCTPAEERPQIELALSRLVLPAAVPRDTPLAIDPRSLPTLAVRSAAFGMDGRRYGALEFRGEPVTSGWRIETLKLTQPHAELRMTGLWSVDRSGEQSTRVELSLQAADSGRLLADFGYPGEVIGGKLLLTARGSWPGAPAEFALATVDSQLYLSFDEGRLPQVSPGAGRLLGVLDLGSVARYLNLDFSQLFGKGLTFDSMKGSVRTSAGQARTESFRIRTPGAEVELSGRVGLVERDLDLEMGVTPRLMEELAVTGGLIGGPAVGAAVALLHNLVRKPLEKGTRIGYTVTGSWQQPVIKRISAPTVEPITHD